MIFKHNFCQIYILTYHVLSHGNSLTEHKTKKKTTKGHYSVSAKLNSR